MERIIFFIVSNYKSYLIWLLFEATKLSKINVSDNKMSHIITIGVADYK